MKTQITMNEVDHYRLDLIPESKSEKAIIDVLAKGNFVTEAFIRSAQDDEPGDGRMVVEVHGRGSNGVRVDLQEVDYEVVDEKGLPAFGNE